LQIRWYVKFIGGLTVLAFCDVQDIADQTACYIFGKFTVLAFGNLQEIADQIVC
jgi:hypothetical protein